MKARAIYNEIEPYAVRYLQNLSAQGLIAHGQVDRRSIQSLRPKDILGSTQAHFFAGIGAWSYALRLAGWPDNRPVWTGSCPCQPFSTSGQKKGFADERHLWPAWFRLIEKCRPAAVFGEQVASLDGLGWLDTVCSDLEGAGYSVGAADLCAAGVGAPHIRQRLFFVAYARGVSRRLLLRPRDAHHQVAETPGRREARGVAHSEETRLDGGQDSRADRQTPRGRTRSEQPSRDSSAGELGNPSGARSRRSTGSVSRAEEKGDQQWSPTRNFTHEPLDAGAVGGLADTEVIGRPRRLAVAWRDSSFAKPAADRHRNAGATRGFWGGGRLDLLPRRKVARS